MTSKIAEQFVANAQKAARVAKTEILRNWQDSDGNPLGRSAMIDVELTYIGLVALTLEEEGYPVEVLGGVDIDNNDELFTYLRVDYSVKDAAWWNDKVDLNANSEQAE